MFIYPHNRYVDFYTDYAFKKFFGTEANKDLLIDFLNQLFDGEEVIEDIYYLPVEQFSQIEKERKAIFDIFCKSIDGTCFIVEMQNAKQDYFKDRTIYYVSFPVQEQATLNRGGYDLKKIYSVNILNFNLDKTAEDEQWEKEHNTVDTRYLKEVKLQDTEKNTVFYDKLTFIYLEMPNFNKELNECTTLFDKWLYAIKHLATMENQPDELKSAIFNRLFELAEVAKFNRNEYMAYRMSLDAMRDNQGVIETRYKEGRVDEKFANARKMKELGVSADIIVKVSGLSIDEIKNL